VARPWTQDLGIFLGQMLLIETGPRFAGREPHRRGRIPVVFVHGTASNFSVWVNMLNDLDSDPVIRKHFEFWFFRYDSGQPILYSGSLLRHALTEAVNAFQADGPDPCLDAMVVIGHSQGGLLVKLTAIDSGDLFWRNVSDVSFEEFELSDETRTLFREALFVEPLPFVNRVVFIATPHRGSYLAGPGIVRRLAQRLITLPATLVRGGAELLATDDVRRRTRLERLPTSIDNMSPGHPFIVTVAKIPVSPDVAAHSIIGVTGDGPIESGGDGVVKYSSAHIDGVESELVVPYPHSMQAEPEVVAEVQRILHHHLQLNPCVESAPF
jgi:pimeloyl-ACP methyl ester carboxylesterase